jgi:hypothetical protein
VIDVGRSYQNLCETLDGDFMAYSADQPICLNPFELTALGGGGRRGGGAGHCDGRADREAIRLPESLKFALILQYSKI